MPRTARKSFALTKAHARRIWLRAQRLDEDAPFGDGPGATRAAVCYLDAPRKPAMRRLIERRVRRKELMPVALEGAGKLEHWARPEALESSFDSIDERVHILSLFDPLIHQRKRLQLFFDYEHRSTSTTSTASSASNSHAKRGLLPPLPLAGEGWGEGPALSSHKL